MLLAKTSYGYHYTLVKIHPYPKCFVAKLSKCIHNPGKI